MLLVYCKLFFYHRIGGNFYEISFLMSILIGLLIFFDFFFCLCFMLKKCLLIGVLGDNCSFIYENLRNLSNCFCYRINFILNIVLLLQNKNTVAEGQETY